MYTLKENQSQPQAAGLVDGGNNFDFGLINVMEDFGSEEVSVRDSTRVERLIENSIY